MATLTAKDIDSLTGYADGEVRIRRKHRINHAEILNLALDFQVEQCSHCGWWSESYEMIPDGADAPDGRCENCRR